MKTLSRYLKLGGVAIATAALALSFGACTSGNSSATSSGSPVTITLLSHYNTDPMQSQLTAYVDEWNKANPDIQVKLQPVDFNNLQTTLNVRQAGGSGADILSSYALWGGQLAQNNVLAAPPADVADDIKQNYSAAAVDAVTGPDGQFFGYPTEFNTYVLFYNKSILKAAGFDSPPSTWAQLEAIANKTTAKDSSGNYKVEGLSLTNAGDAPTAHPFLALLNSAKGDFVTSSGTSALDDKAKQALQLEAGLAKSGATTMSVSPLASFPTGGVAMAIQASWWIGTLQSQIKDYSNVVGTAPVPGPNEGDNGSLAYAFFMGVNSGSKHQAEAWKFLAWFNSVAQSDGVTRVGDWMAENGEIPPRKADADKLGPALEAKDPNLKPVYDAASYAMAEANTANATKAKNDLDTALQAMIVKGVSADDTYDTLVSALNG